MPSECTVIAVSHTPILLNLCHLVEKKRGFVSPNFCACFLEVLGWDRCFGYVSHFYTATEINGNLTSRGKLCAHIRQCAVGGGNARLQCAEKLIEKFAVIAELLEVFLLVLTLCC